MLGFVCQSETHLLGLVDVGLKQESIVGLGWMCFSTDVEHPDSSVGVGHCRTYHHAFERLKGRIGDLQTESVHLLTDRPNLELRSEVFGDFHFGDWLVPHIVEFHHSRDWLPTSGLEKEVGQFLEYLCHLPHESVAP